MWEGGTSNGCCKMILAIVWGGQNCKLDGLKWNENTADCLLCFPFRLNRQEQSHTSSTMLGLPPRCPSLHFPCLNSEGVCVHTNCLNLFPILRLLRPQGHGVLEAVKAPGPWGT